MSAVLVGQVVQVMTCEVNVNKVDEMKKKDPVYFMDDNWPQGGCRDGTFCVFRGSLLQ